MRVPFFDYPLQYQQYRSEYAKIIEDVLSRGAYISGPDCKNFEEHLAQFVGAKYAVGVGNCTDALLLALHAAGIEPGDEVITVSHTFVATVEVIVFLHATPIFVDIGSDHLMDVDCVERAITSRTKAIVPVQLNGRICGGMEKLLSIARQHNLVLIEDAAQALGATYHKRGAGTFGKAGCFSFYPAKLLGAFGDAGAIVTDDESFAHTVRLLRDHGRGGPAGEVEAWGLNARLDNLHAAVLDYKLKNFLDKWIVRRRYIAHLYHEALGDISDLSLPPPPMEGEHFDVFQNYEIEAERRDALALHLREKGIGTTLPWGGKGVHQFSRLGFPSHSLPCTERFFRKALMLPLYPELTDQQVHYVADQIRAFYETNNV